MSTSVLRSLSAALLAVGLLFTAAAPAQAQSWADNRPVRGLIVRLKDAPSHLELAAQRGAPEREQAKARVAAQKEGQRWQRVVNESGLGERSGRVAPQLRPLGRDQQLLAFPQPLSLEEAQSLRAKLAARPDVAWVEFNTRERRLQVPNDPYYSDGSQWWLRAPTGTNGNILSDRRRGLPNFQNAWTRVGGTGSAAAVVAVLDTGIVYHPDLAGRILSGFDFVADSPYSGDGDGRDADPSDPGDFVDATDRTNAAFAGCDIVDSTWHGTVIAGLVAAGTNNGQGMAATSWNGRVLPVRVAGKCGADVADIVEGMRWAAGLSACKRDDGSGACVEFVPANANPSRIINISFGGSNACGAAYQSAVDELHFAANAVVIAAAGNEHSAPTRPANCTGVVGVAALNRDGFKAHYSNFGAALQASGVATVGGDDAQDSSSRWNALADPGILSVGNTGATTPGAPSYYYFWGTSFSAPIVSGAVSLMLSVNPALSAAQIIEGLQRSARPHAISPLIAACSDSNPGRCLCTTATCGAGMLDVDQALAYATNPGGYIAPALSPVVLDNADIAAAVALGPDRVSNGPVTSPDSGGGGGGAFAPLGLLGLAGAALALLWASSRRRATRVARR